MFYRHLNRQIDALPGKFNGETLGLWASTWYPKIDWQSDLYLQREVVKILARNKLKTKTRGVDKTIEAIKDLPAHERDRVLRWLEGK